MFPVRFAANTQSSARKLLAPATPVTAVIATTSDGNTRERRRDAFADSPPGMSKGQGLTTSFGSGCVN
jgi:hypothetical protein